MPSPFAGLTIDGRGEFLSCESGKIVAESTSCLVCYVEGSEGLHPQGQAVQEQ